MKGHNNEFTYKITDSELKTKIITILFKKTSKFCIWIIVRLIITAIGHTHALTDSIIF